MFYLLIVGSRSFDNYNTLATVCDKLLVNHTEITIVSGGADGADKLAERYAKERDYALKVFTAEWSKFGNSAGYKRNEDMHRYISQFTHRGVVAFWDGFSKGTAHSFELAPKFHNPIRIYTV